MKKYANFILLACTIFSLPSIGYSLGLNDVSYLLPLPKLSEYDLSPAPNTVGDKGEILAYSKISHIQPLLETSSNRELYPTLKMVGIRMDPCFHEGLGPVQCLKQIRIVWQPVIKVRNGTSTADVALHIFYKLTDSEFVQLSQKIKKLSSDFPVLPLHLSVNPILQKQGYGSVYAQRLFSIIQQFCGSSNISRTTFMSLNIGGNVWTFGGYDFTATGLKVMIVPRLSSANQFFSNSALQNPTKFQGGLAPEPQGENINLLVKDSTKLLKLSEQQIKDSMKAAHRFENPLKHNAGTLDCMSCHLAQTARIHTVTKFSKIDFSSIGLKENYKAPTDLKLDLKNKSPLQNQTNILRAFGYFNDQPIVSQRTINESAEVVRMMNQL
jgi:hypothetical protein